MAEKEFGRLYATWGACLLGFSGCVACIANSGNREEGTVFIWAGIICGATLGRILGGMVGQRITSDAMPPNQSLKLTEPAISFSPRAKKFLRERRCLPRV